MVPLATTASQKVRNIYYQDPDLFKSQSHVDELVDDLAFTLGVGRNALHIVRMLSLYPLVMFH